MKRRMTTILMVVGILAAVGSGGSVPAAQGQTDSRYFSETQQTLRSS